MGPSIVLREFWGTLRLSNKMTLTERTLKFFSAKLSYFSGGRFLGSRLLLEVFHTPRPPEDNFKKYSVPEQGHNEMGFGDINPIQLKLYYLPKMRYFAYQFPKFLWKRKISQPIMHLSTMSKVIQRAQTLSKDIAPCYSPGV